MQKKRDSYLKVKRALDVILSGGAIVLLSPLMGAIALAIKLDSPGPVFYRAASGRSGLERIRNILRF